MRCRRHRIPIWIAAIALAATIGRAAVVYTYDSAGRLIQANYGAAGVVTYTYDSAGHLISRQVQVNPVLTSLSPSTAPAESASFSLIVNGSDFVPGATVQWTPSGGSQQSLPATFVSSLQLQATIPASYLASPGIVQVAVQNPGNSTSGQLPFAISTSPCDLKQNGNVGVGDAQEIVNEALGSTPAAHDLNHDGAVNVVDLQNVLDASLGFGCLAPYVAPGGASISNLATVLRLPAARMNLYGMVTGGAAASSPFAIGQYVQAVDANGNPAAELAYEAGNSNSFTTSTANPVIAGVSVFGDWDSLTAFNGSDTQPGASEASVTFTVTENSLVVFFGLASSQQSISLAGVPGLQVDALESGASAYAGVEIAHAYLSPGLYTVTGQSGVLAAGQNQGNMADLIGVFVFGSSNYLPTVPAMVISPSHAAH